jgi:DNA-binding NtrC family response regulator
LRLYQPAGREYRLSPSVLRELEMHPWPGNVRELANAIRRAVALSPSDEIGPGLWAMTPARGSGPVPVTLEESERLLFSRTLEATRGNRSHAAAQLGVSLRTVRNKIREYGLPPRSSYAHS